MSDWTPSPEAWAKFLLLLDADQEVAGEKYEVLRRKLMIFFECRKCKTASEDLADETITRVMRRNCEGVHIDDATRYAYGVARIVAKEDYVKSRRADSTRDELLRRHGDSYIEKKDGEDGELLHQAFDECLNELSDGNRKFILEYYENTGRKKIDNRNSLTEKLAVSRNAVTLRAYQLRKKIDKCVKARLKRLG
jgi:DNA-directed RNA polymerase specialized sigma24 family protein